MKESFEQMLTGGHPNSLGRTVEVVNVILEDKSKLQDLYQCYFSKDEVVRLRVSSAMKRICKAHPDWLISYIDKLIIEISKINQASTQWTLAILFLDLYKKMTPKQLEGAIEIMKRNIIENKDWIVQNTTMQSLFEISKENENLQNWLKPHLENLSKDKHKSVAGRAKKLLKLL
jgi:hypothetical protein